MKIFITGGAGFIGSNLIKKLLKEYSLLKIISLDNYSTGTEKNHIISENVIYIKGDTWDIFNIKEIMEFDPEYIFHFGEYSRIVQSLKEPSKVFLSNNYGTQQILEFAVLKNSKLIYSGSSAIFGENNENKNKDLNPYVFTKSKNIELIHKYKTWFGLNFAICYFYNVYGPGQICEGDYATVIGIFENQIKNNQDLTVVYPGTQTRIFTHIDDIIEGVLLVATKGCGDGYYLGTQKNISILEIIKMFDKNYVFIEKREGERLNSAISDETKNKANYELNWYPKIELENYIKNFNKNFFK
jgi:UDP-glucose 4-epimerase